MKRQSLTCAYERRRLTSNGGVRRWFVRAGRVLPALGIAVAALGAEAAALDPTLKLFLAKFADMAAHGAADSMVKVTRFPLKNRVHQEPDKVSAAGFKHHFALNHFRDLAGCLKDTPPKRADAKSVEMGEWVVDCDGNVFYFAQESGGWRFSGFENVNE